MTKVADFIRLKALALFVTGCACVTIGVAYLVPNAPDGAVRQLTLIETIAPLHVVAWVWVAAGVACVASIVCRRMRPFVFGGAAFLHVMWALSYLGSNLFLEDSGRDWVSARSYLVIAALILVAAGIKEGPRRWVIRSRSR